MICAGIDQSRLAKPTLKANRPNPLHPRQPPTYDELNPSNDTKRYNAGVIKKVTQAINQFYKMMKVEYDDREQEKYITSNQTSKVLLPLLAEIIAHAKKNPSPGKLRKYLKGMDSWMTQMKVKETRITRERRASKIGSSGEEVKNVCLEIRRSGNIPKPKSSI